MSYKQIVPSSPLPRYTVGSHQSSTPYTVVYVCQSKCPNLSHLPFPPLGSVCLFSTSVSLFLSCKQVHVYYFFLDPTYMCYYMIFVALFLTTSLSMTVSRSIYICANGTILYLFMVELYSIVQYISPIFFKSNPLLIFIQVAHMSSLL